MTDRVWVSICECGEEFELDTHEKRLRSFDHYSITRHKVKRRVYREVDNV